jgi:hypothetical protein
MEARSTMPEFDVIVVRAENAALAAVSARKPRKASGSRACPFEAAERRGAQVHANDPGGPAPTSGAVVGRLAGAGTAGA